MARKEGFRNQKSFLKQEQLQKLASWAGGEASIPSLAAFFGRRLAAASEALDAPPNPSLVMCQRCETILQPGFNCTVRIEKSRAKPRRRRKKPNTSTRNNVVYKCHFCSHHNLKRGTPRGHMKDICPPKPKPAGESEPLTSKRQNPACLAKSASGKDEIIKVDDMALPGGSRDNSVPNSPATPSVSLLDAKKRIRNRSGSKNPKQPEGSSAATDSDQTVSASSKRKRKRWTSLREIVESKKHDSSQNLGTLTIPFFAL